MASPEPTLCMGDGMEPLPVPVLMGWFLLGTSGGISVSLLNDRISRFEKGGREAGPLGGLVPGLLLWVRVGVSGILSILGAAVSPLNAASTAIMIKNCSKYCYPEEMIWIHKSQNLV